MDVSDFDCFWHRQGMCWFSMFISVLCKPVHIIYIYIHTYTYTYRYTYMIVHHNLCFNLFILHIHILYIYTIYIYIYIYMCIHNRKKSYDVPNKLMNHFLWVLSHFLLIYLLLLLWLPLLLSFKVLRSKSRSIKANSQPRSHFNPGCQVVLWRMLSDYARVQRSKMRQCKEHEDDVKKHQ